MFKQYKHIFNIPKHHKRKIDNVFSSFNFNYQPKEYSFDSSLTYEFDLLSTVRGADLLNRALSEIVPVITSNPYDSEYEPITEFIFEKRDYDAAPFFKLCSSGNSESAFLESRCLKIEKHFVCDSCGVHTRELLSPLEVNGTKIGKRLMVNVNTEYWVINEKLATLFDEWNLQGYKLEEVISRDTENRKLFRIIPEIVLPLWSETTEFLYFDRAQCCNLRNSVPGPFHYHTSDLQDIKTDFASTNELVVSGNLAFRPLMVSSKFRELIISNNISKEVINIYDSNYRSFNWLFEPIVVSSK